MLREFIETLSIYAIDSNMNDGVFFQLSPDTLIERISDTIKEAVKKSIDEALAAKEKEKEPLLTRSGAAKFLSVHVTTIDRYKTLGLLPFVKIGGSTRYKIEDVEKLKKG